MPRLLHLALAFLLFGCLFDWPYGYYQFVRWAALVGFGLLAYHYGTGGRTVAAIVCVGLALLFQPLEKIALGRELWNIVDVVVGAGLLLTLPRRQSERAN